MTLSSILICIGIVAYCSYKYTDYKAEQIRDDPRSTDMWWDLGCYTLPVAVICWVAGVIAAILQY